MFLRFLQTEFEDPRQRFIPNARPLDGDLPEGEVPSGNLGDTDIGVSNIDLFSWFSNLFDGDWWVWLFTATGIGAVLGFLWSLYVFLAYLLCLLLLLLYVYASVRKAQLNEIEEQILRDNERVYDEYYRPENQPSRLAQVQQHITTDNPNDWKLAIIEADIILDDTLKEKGYAGTSLGERLRSISPTQLATLNDAWEAHKIRNQIAHQGSDFILTERLARETVQRYLRVFEEFEVR